MSNSIYVSSSCLKSAKISESVFALANHGIKHIELSGGTNYYSGYIDDLIELKERYGLHYRVHNYFPPPIQHGVINLASSTRSIYDQSVSIIQKAYELVSCGLAECYSFHAGFCFDMKVEDLGVSVSREALTFISMNEGYTNFVKNVTFLNEKHSHDIIIENNVVSRANYLRQSGNRFLLTDSKGFFEMKNDLNFELLLDLAHLKVSSNTLGLDFEVEFENLFHNSDYIHVSDNDGLSDLNLPIKENSHLIGLIANSSCQGKDFTIEVYTGLRDVLNTYNLLLKHI